MQDRDRAARRRRCSPATSSCSTHPYNGGTHLPDVTVITPVFLTRRGASSVFYVALRAATTPTSAASRRARCRRSRTRIDEEGVLIDNVQLVERRPLPRGARCARCSASGRYPARNPTQNLADLRAQVAANEKGAQELRAHGRAVRARRRAAPTCATCRTTPRRAVRRVIDALKDGAFAYAHGQRRRDPRRDPRSTAPRAAPTIDFTGTSAAAAEQLQRAVGRVHGRGALRVPHAGRRRHPDERRLPEAARRSIIPEGSMLKPRYAGGGRRRQRRDLAVRHRRAVRRARRDGRRRRAR